MFRNGENPAQLDNILMDFQSKLDNSKEDPNESNKSNDLPGTDNLWFL
jgi:hypothetical protein